LKTPPGLEQLQTPRCTKYPRVFEKIETMNNNYHKNLSNYFAGKSLYLDEPTQKKPNIRKLVEQPWQQTKGEMWDDVTDTLCNLDFIQAKAAAKMTFDLVKDFNIVLQVIPENAENFRQEKARLDRMEKYAEDLILCSKGEITTLEIPDSISPWTEEQINVEFERIKTNLNRTDFIKDFANFLRREASNLQKYAHKIDHFTTQQAWNYADAGPVGLSAEKGRPEIFKSLLLLCSSHTRPEWNPMPKILFILYKHTDWVSTVSITPDGKWAISGSWDKTCILWDLTTGQVLQTLKGHQESVTTVSITPDGKCAISGSADKTCIVWDLISGVPMQIFKGHNGWITAVSITYDGQKAISCSGDNCFLWDVKTSNVLMTLKGLGGGYAVNFSPNCKMAIYISEYGYTSWDLSSGEILQSHKGQNGGFQAFSITPDCRLGISCSKGNTGIVWDLKNNMAIQTLDGHYKAILSTAIMADGEKAISGSRDNACIVWNLLSGKSLKTIKRDAGLCNHVSITPDGKRAISSYHDGTCILWDLESGSPIQSLIGHNGPIMSVSITPDNKKAITGSNDDTCIFWDLNTGKSIFTLKGYGGQFQVVSLTPDGQSAISGAADGTCFLWDLKTGDVIFALKRHEGPVNAISFNADGKWAISGSDDGTCILWDLISGNEQLILIGHASQVKCVFITNDGKRAISGDVKGTCIVWDLISGELLKNLNGHTDMVSAVSITPDGRQGISGSLDNTCIVWDLTSGEALHVLKEHTGKIFDVSISFDGKRTITSSEDRSCILWDIVQGERLSVFTTNSEIYEGKLFRSGILLSTSSGVFIVNVEKEWLCPSAPITSTRQIWDYNLQKHQDPSADCPLCGNRFAPPESVLNIINEITNNAGLKPEQSSCLELPNEYWDDPGLECNCPSCGEKLKFNPFFVIDLKKEKERLFMKISKDAEKAEKNCEWDNACKLYLKLIRLEGYAFGNFMMRFYHDNGPEGIDICDLLVKYSVCGINSMNELDDSIYMNIGYIIGMLAEKGETQKAQFIENKLENFLSLDIADRQKIRLKNDEDQRKLNEIFEKAENAFKDGDWDNAIKLYLKLIQADRFDISYMRFNMAICKINSLNEKNKSEIITKLF